MNKIILFILLPVLLTGCAKKQDGVAAEQDILARVGGQTITRQEVNNKMALLSEDDKEFVKSPLGRHNFIQILVREKLAELAAKQEGLNKSDAYLSSLEDKRHELDRIYKDFSAELLERSWYNQLDESGATSVTEEEIKDYYKKYPYEMTIKQIILNNAQTADEVLRALKGSPSRWKTLNRQYSIAPEATKDDAFSFMPGEFLPEIEVIAANSSTGSVQGFIKTAQGFHIIMKTGEKRLAFANARPRIEQILKDQKMDVVLSNLKNKYEVVMYDKTE